MPNIFLLRDNEQFIEMEERCYDSERVLQELLSKYPSILSSDNHMGGEPRRWLLLQAEAGLSDTEQGSNRWSVDHLFVDQYGVPTIVEVKRSSDTRIRREVVGQMLEYAANAVAYWNVDALRAKFSETCRISASDPAEKLNLFLGETSSPVGLTPDTFWQAVSQNLEAAKVRLIFVADEIPAELRRIVEFLNEQMKSAEVLAVEVKQFVGAGARTLVPRIIGQTMKAESAKSGNSSRGVARQWNETSFLEVLETNEGKSCADVARQIIDWAKVHMPDFWWGQGSRDGSCFCGIRRNDRVLYCCALWTYGTVEIQFQWLRDRPPFDDIGLRQELAERLNVIPGIRIPSDGINRRPGFQIDVLSVNTSLEAFFGVLTWFKEQALRGHAPNSNAS